MEKLRARCYLRVSTDEQAMEGFSLSAQEEKCRQFIESQGWQYDGEYIDDGYSAKDLNRPGMQRLLHDIKERQFDILVVYRLDRLVRSVVDLHHLVRLFDERGIMFKSVTEVFDTTNAMGRFFITLVGAMAQWERENLAERVRMGMERRAAEGKFNGSAVPYGYRLEGDKLVIEPGEAELVRRIFRMYKQYGMDTIANMLNAEGLKTRRGNNWDPNVIKYMLSNPIYFGRMVWGRKTRSKVITIDGAAPAIISEEEFQEAQRIMKKRLSMPARGKSATSDYIFAGILSCGYCGRKLYGSNRRGTYYYGCTNRYKNWKNCPMPRVNERAVIQEVFRVIDFVADNDEIEPEQEEKQDASIRRQELEKQLEVIKKRRKKRLMAFENSIITLEELRERNQEDAEKEEKILRELEELGTADEEGQPLDKETFLAYVQDLRQLWPQMDRRGQKKLIQTIFRDIVIVEAPNQPKYPGRHGLKKVNIVDYVLNT